MAAACCGDRDEHESDHDDERRDKHLDGVPTILFFYILFFAQLYLLRFGRRPTTGAPLLEPRRLVFLTLRQDIRLPVAAEIAAF